MNLVSLANHPDVAVLLITKFRRLVDEIWPKSTGLKHFCTCNCSIWFNFFHLFQLCCTSLQTLTSHCTFCSQRLWRILSLPIRMVVQIQENLRLNWLLTASLFYSKVFHPTLFWRWMNHPQFSSKFPMLSYFEVDLIDLDPWHQFFSDSLGLIKVISCSLKWTWWGAIHQFCTCSWHTLLILLKIPYLLKIWRGHLHKNSFRGLLMRLFQILTHFLQRFF